VLLSTEKHTFDGKTVLILQETTRWVLQYQKPEAQAFTTQHFNVGSGKAKKEIRRCTHYKRDGHTQDTCWVLHPHLRPTRIERSQSEEVKRRDFAQTLNAREGEKRIMVSGEGLNRK
jgi:hypothetical protein